MKKIEVRKDGKKRVYTVNEEPSKTDQSFQTECDVNHIVQKYLKTGRINHLARMQGQFADVSEIPDLLEAIKTVTSAQQTFDELPAELRRKFGNSPVNMVEYLQDPSNDIEAVKLGLKEYPPTNEIRGEATTQEAVAKETSHKSDKK